MLCRNLLLATFLTAAATGSPLTNEESSAAEKSCDELFRESESLWLEHDYNGSDKALELARKKCPDRAEVLWRTARNEYDRIERIPRDRKPPKEELVKRYKKVEKLADKCIQLDQKDGNCWLWKAVGIGRRSSTQGMLAAIPMVDDMERTLLKALELKPGYRAIDGTANSTADLNSMLGIFYRVLPEWTCTFPFNEILGTCGDLDKSIEFHRKAVEMEPGRLEYHKELAISLLCRGQKRGRPQEIEEGKKILRELQSLPEIKATDGIDKEHSMMLIEDPSLACGYSRDAQQEQSKEAFEMR